MIVLHDTRADRRLDVRHLELRPELCPSTYIVRLTGSTIWHHVPGMPKDWMNFHYASPDPDQLPAELHTIG